MNIINNCIFLKLIKTSESGYNTSSRADKNRAGIEKPNYIILVRFGLIFLKISVNSMFGLKFNNNSIWFGCAKNKFNLIGINEI